MKKPLEHYAEKRHFEKTPEPAADHLPQRAGPLLFGIQMHAATRLHYDLRLELDGVLKSWAVPKGLSLDTEDKHLAVEVEDHPFDYLLFEGLIPKNEYGGGEVILWDTGIYQPDEPQEMCTADRETQQDHVRKSLAEGKLSFLLRGSKAKGSWTLVRMKDEKNWLLIKHRDPYVSEDRKLTDLVQSAVSGLTVEDLKNGRLPPDARQFRCVEQATSETALPPKLMPMLASTTDKPFDHPDWIFEPKLDGIRCLALIQCDEVKLISRNGLDISRQFPDLTNALKAQRLRNTVLDGEIIAYGEDGAGSFYNTITRLKQEKAGDIERETARMKSIFHPFDLLLLEGIDMRACGLIARKLKLGQILLSHELISPVAYSEGDGHAMFDVSVQAGFEGVVAKRKDSRYELGRRSDSWRKVKAFKSSEFIVGGWKKGLGSRTDSFGSLMLGILQDGKFTYCGNVGSGFNDGHLGNLKSRLEALTQSDCPFVPKLPAKSGTWVKPEIVVEVKYSEWTPDGSLRHPVFVRVRDDVPLQQATVEQRATIGTADTSAAGGNGLQMADASLLEQLDRDKQNIVLEIEGNELPVTNLDKVYWPKSEVLPEAICKRDYLKYLAQVGHAMLTHLRDRPFTMIRMPEGIEGERFFQKHWDAKLPPFVETLELYSGSKKEDHKYVLCNNLATLLWLGQIGSLEAHVWGSRIAKEPDGAHLSIQTTGSEETIDKSILNYPDYISFDMDPYLYSGKEKEGEEPEFNHQAFDNAKKVAMHLKELIEAIGLIPYVKTTGKTGIHIFAPIQRTLTFDQTRQICEAMSTLILSEYPDEVTTEWSVVKRTGKTFLDYNMNARSKTLAAAYSPRSLPGAFVSMPITWEELPEIYPTDFTFEVAVQSLKEKGDAWGSILEDKRLLDLGSIGLKVS